MKINKKYRNILVGFSVIICYLSSCIPAMDSVTFVHLKNCTNDTLIIGESDYDNIDSVWFDPIDADRLSKEPLFTSIDSILLDINKDYLESCEFYDEENITPEELTEKNKEGMITYPDSLYLVNEYLLFDKYFFLIKLEDAKNHSWDEIRAKKLYKKWNVVRKKYGGYDRNIRYSE